MSLMEEYAVDLDSVPDGPDYSVEDGIYEFEVGDVFMKRGTANVPDGIWIVVEYLLGDEGKKKSDWFRMPADSTDPTSKELQYLSFYKQRLGDLGVAPEDRNTVTREDLVGLTGTLHIITTKGKDQKMYQNISKVKLGEVAEAAAPAKAPAARAARAPKAAPSTAVNNPFAKK